MDLQIEHLSSQGPEDWYHAWISEKTLIDPIVKIECLPQTGGALILHAQLGEEIRRMEGRFLELVPIEKLVYTWQWQGNDECTQVAVQFEVKQAGTRILLTHQGFTNAENREAHLQGWRTYLTGVEAILGNS